ncbi:MAG TPA: tRNA 2-thiouridine(34) synthase MnmA [Acidimicrobiales bacterium]|nr:tRNA 2-thiouridine(34) synthase MnmA [Acidimicrobiales bacterium]
MKVLAAMSGGVDSSVAAALLVEEGHDVTGVTLRLWDNPTDAGCCSVTEIDDARRVTNVLGIDHLVWTFVDEFDGRVVEPYAAAHAQGLTPNPCIECNRHLKFGRLLRRATQLGFDAVATGHHARVVTDGHHRLLRGADARKDQSYVLYVLGQEELARCRFPVGTMTKTAVRAKAAALGLPTAEKPDSQDVCFVTTSGGRRALLASRIPLHPGRVVDRTGAEVGRVEAVELVTPGQRRGLGTGGGDRRYALAVDTAARTVLVGSAADLEVDSVALDQLCWVHEPVEGEVEAQTSAHAVPVEATFDGARVRFRGRHRRVAPGQSVVLYRGEEVLGGGIVGA